MFNSTGCRTWDVEIGAVGDPPLGRVEPLVVAMSCWSVCVRLRRRGTRAVGEDGGVGGRRCGGGGRW